MVAEYFATRSECKSTVSIRSGSEHRSLPDGRAPLHLGATLDLKSYFRKIRQTEEDIGEPHTFVMSLETSDGGRAGLLTEVSREIAAKMIVEGRAVLANKTDRERFLESQASARSAAQRAELAQRLQVTIVSDGESLRPSVSASSNNPAKK